MSGYWLNAAPVLVAHGTRAAAGVDMIAQLAEKVSAVIGPTRVAFVDVLGPSPSELLSTIDRPAAVIPAFLATGYHVRTDLPEHVAASQHPAVEVARSLGPDPTIARVMHRRLVECGWRRGDHVVLAAAGSSDPIALGQVRQSAVMLSGLVGCELPVGYIATATPHINDVVVQAKSAGRRVFVASYLLADGLFHRRLRDCGADGVAAPLGCDEAIVDLVVSRARSIDRLRV